MTPDVVLLSFFKYVNKTDIKNRFTGYFFRQNSIMLLILLDL